MLLLQAVPSDDTAAMVRCMAETLPPQALAQVQYLSVDNPSTKLVRQAQGIFPNLQVVALDPTHLAMTCEYASSRKRTAATKCLRVILRKLTARGTCCASTWGPAFDGSTVTPLSHEEERARAQIEDKSMSRAHAERILNNLDPEKPFVLRLEWIQALAALASVHRSEMEKTAPGPNRKIYEMLHSAAAASRVGWYFNNLIMRHSLPTSRLSLLPIGTTSNEALHHEINTWFRETQKMYQGTLSLKLIIMHLGKVLARNSAWYRPTTRQMPEAELLARISGRQLWSDSEWAAWCSSLDAGCKAQLPIHEKRKQQQGLVKQKSFKRPAAAAAAAASEDTSLHRKRTPNTLYS